jgi:hypothetical protein
VRAFAICAVLAACGGPEPPPFLHGPGGVAAIAPARGVPAERVASGDPAGAAASSPGPRLPDGVAPVSYDLTLELDPAREIFTGHVSIEIAVAAPGTTRLWLHAVDLDKIEPALAGAAQPNRAISSRIRGLHGGSSSSPRITHAILSPSRSRSASIPAA